MADIGIRTVRKWKEVEVSDDVIARDWRVRVKYHYKNSEAVEYYCAYSAMCPAKIKKTILPNKVTCVTSNHLEHANHRTLNFGLSQQQKFSSLNETISILYQTRKLESI